MSQTDITSQTQSEFSRQGASSLVATSSQATDALPQIVWIRGDEPYAGDFSLSVEDVMTALGIKRSRLTQISGRELRVGKTRVDRFIKSVYRQADLDEYRAWTRPTATHQKSASIVREAIDGLHEEQKAITERLAAVAQEVDAKVGGLLEELDTLKNLPAFMRSVTQQLAEIEARMKAIGSAKTRAKSVSKPDKKSLKRKKRR